MMKQNPAKRLQPWEKEGVFELHNKGKSQREIAAALNMSVVTVNKLLKQHNKAEKKPRVRKPKPKIIPETENPAETIMEIDLSRLPTEDTMKTDILIAFRASLAETINRLPNMEDKEVVGVVNRLLAELNKNA